MLVQHLHGKPTTTLKIDTQHLKKDTQHLGQRKEGKRAAHRLESRRQKGNDASQTKGHYGDDLGEKAELGEHQNRKESRTETLLKP
jgi:hypothetical protein